MGDRGRELTHGGDAVGVRELQLRLAVSPLAFASFCLYCPQRCLCLLRAYDRRHIGAGAAITAEFSVSVKHWLAANLHVHWSAVAVHRAIHEVTKRFMGIKSCPNKPPLLRFCFNVESVIPAHRPNPSRRV